ncbi:MAG: 50S ribosomal protein L6 [Patescibacteria group bacterium]
MSRIGKQIITIPQKTEISVSGGIITVKGKEGELKRAFRPEVNVLVEGDHVRVGINSNSKMSRMLWGTTAAHIKNMIHGVNTPYQKELVLEGVGFKSEVKGKELVLAIGFSHPVKVLIPEGINMKAEKNIITISGIDKEKVGQISAYIRSLKKPEPYKGKGFRYRNEVIRRKEGKKSV